MTFVRYLYSLLLFLLCAPAVGFAQCAPTAPDGACFRIIDVATKQEVQTVCVGRRVRFVDCSGQQPNPKLIRYVVGSSVICDAAQFDTVSFYTPTQVGQLVVTQNTQNPARPASGILIIRQLTVQATPAPVFTAQACGPGVVEVSVNDSNYPQYTVQVGSQPAVAGTPGVAQRLPAPAAGSVVITVTGYTDNQVCSATATQTLETAPAYQAPTLQLLSLQNSTTQFTFGNLQSVYQYQLQIRDGGGYRTVATVPGTSPTYTLSTAASGCFRLLLSNICQPAATTPASNELCTVALTATSQNNRTVLTWTTSQDGATFEVMRDGQVLARPPAGTTQYTDEDIACGTIYRYQVRAISAGISESNVVNALAVSTTPPPMAPLLASYNLHNQVVLSIMTPASAAGRYTFLRAGTVLAPPTTVRTFIDSTVTPDPAAPVCYTARVQNNCGVNSADSAPVCPPVLTATAADADGNSIRLTWTALGAPTPAAPVTYRLLTLAPDNTVLATQAVTFPTVTDQQPPTNQQTVRYRLEATGGGLIGVSYSNVATVARRLKLVMPNAFTPNGDGQNDVLEVKGRFLDNFLLVVVDRSGQEVFRATNRSQTWDGRIGGRPPVPATYVWRFEATDVNGQHVTEHGTLTVLR